MFRNCQQLIRIKFFSKASSEWNSTKIHFDLGLSRIGKNQFQIKLDKKRFSSHQKFTLIKSLNIYLNGKFNQYIFILRNQQFWLKINHQFRSKTNHQCRSKPDKKLMLIWKFQQKKTFLSKITNNQFWSGTVEISFYPKLSKIN